jgi:hypothetical protein
VLCAEGIPIFSSIPRKHSHLSITPHRPSASHRDVQKRVKNRDPTEWEIGPGRAGRVSRGCGDSPWCNRGTDSDVGDSRSTGAEAGGNENSGKNVCR